MKRLSRSKRFKMTLLSSLFVLISVPMVMFALISTETTDTRSSADQLMDSYCAISFPFINSQTVQAGAVVSVEMVAFPPEGETIQSIKVTTSEGSTIFDQVYDQYESYIAERTTFTTTQTGPVSLSGFMTTDVSTYTCQLTDSIDNTMIVLALNDAPKFTSDPQTAAEPSNSLVVGDSYRYELTALDSDGDDIEYSYSFTPRADWLTMSIVKPGDGGNLQLVFEGVTDEPASYLANVFIHDGYNQHLRSQSWVISVDPKENDTPVVSVVKPTEGTTVKQGESLVAQWNATDQNQIIGYKLFYTTNPGKAETWVTIDNNISYKSNSYVIDTGSMNPGQYRLIVQAQDNQTPPAIGSGTSGLFSIVKKDEPPIVVPDPGDDEPTDDEPDDGVVLQDPQIVNVTPADKSIVSDLKQIISATMVAGTDAGIVKETITFKLDGVDLTEQIELSEITISEMTLIYNPSSDQEIGEHKVDVSFADSEGGIGTRQWTFTIEEPEDDDDSVEIFGFKISKRTMWIIIIGLGLIILAIVVPWVIYLVWRNNDNDSSSYENDSVYHTPPPLPPSSWSSANRFKDTKPIVDDTITSTPAKIEKSKPKQESYKPKVALVPPVVPSTNSPSDADEYNTITGGIVKKPKFQTLTQNPVIEKQKSSEQQKSIEQKKETVNNDEPDSESKQVDQFQHPLDMLPKGLNELAESLNKHISEDTRSRPDTSVQNVDTVKENEKDLKPLTDPNKIVPDNKGVIPQPTFVAKSPVNSEEKAPQSTTPESSVTKKEAFKTPPVLSPTAPNQTGEVWKPRVIIPPKSN